MFWTIVSRADPRARQLADRHYSRQHVGAVGICPPGNSIVLLHVLSAMLAQLAVCEPRNKTVGLMIEQARTIIQGTLERGK